MQGKTVKMVGNMVRAGLTALALVAAPAAALAQDGGQPSSQVGGLKLGNSKAPVKIDADKLEMHDKEGKAIFTGNVVVQQGDALLRASQMTVYYVKAKKGADQKDAGQKGGADAKPAASGPGVGGLDSSSIDHIDLTGKVYLRSGTQVATGDTGHYDAKNQVMTLQGQKVVLTDGENVVTGCKLVAHLDTGLANVDSCKGPSSGRVSIIMAPKDQQPQHGAPAAPKQK